MAARIKERGSEICGNFLIKCVVGKLVTVIYIYILMEWWPRRCGYKLEFILPIKSSKQVGDWEREKQRLRELQREEARADSAMAVSGRELPKLPRE